ncbi:MAG: hypothetical protein V7785_20205 [Bermanella sp.]
MKTYRWILLLSVLQACAFYPTTQYSADVERCDLNFKKLTLDMSASKVQCQGGGNNAGACIILAGVITGGSAVVSGSIVLVGNSLHWLEKQGKCDDSFLNKNIFNHNQPLLEKEGVMVKEQSKAPQ